MNRLANGTEYRENDYGLILVRGKRTLHLLGSSVAAMEKARALAASRSFSALFSKANHAPAAGRNVGYIKVAA